MLTDELRYKLLQQLEKNPQMSQRDMAKALGISLGKVNFCVNALLEVGWLKAKNFKNNQNKLGYAYILTPKGIEEKSRVTSRFLKRKLEEYEELSAEIEEIKRQLDLGDSQEFTAVR